MGKSFNGNRFQAIIIQWKYLYKATPDGYCGDEDNCQTSAWYLFSATGFYPVTPATDQYVLGAPLFKRVTAKLENGKEIIIEAPENSSKNIYVKQMQMNGQNYDLNWISHQELMGGATIEFRMSSFPELKKGTSSASFPYSYSDENK